MNVMNERMVVLRCAAHPNWIQSLFSKGYEVSQKTNESMTTTLESALVQPQRLDCLFIDCARNRQAVIALEIRDSRPRVDAQRPCD
jgi:hypothetical protein